MNPDPESLRSQPAIFVIFGITGNLARHRLLPALYHLMKDDLLDEHTIIVGASRRELSVDELINTVELCVLEEDKVCDPAVLEKFRKHLRSVRLDATNEEDYDHLLETLNTIENEQGMCMHRLYYLSIPPQVYEPVIRNLGEHGLNAGCPHHKGESRLLVEKPFGYDLASATELIENTARYFSESQVFRIDHYLAKETAQNILVFRSHNPVFASVWNNQQVSAIDITLSEQIGVEGRADFYDNVGALRDVVQNHVMQLLALVTMELPADNTSHALHESKKQLMAAIQPVDPATDRVVRGQYAGYADEVHNPGSVTETFVSLDLHIDNERWRGVPVTLTAGKALESKHTTITLTFSQPEQPATMNKLTFRIQPNEGIDVVLTVKQPGFRRETDQVRMNFSYADVFERPEHPEAYERVLLDAINGNHSLFATSDEILESWRVFEHVLQAWANSSADLLGYEPGAAGPVEAQALHAL